MNKLYVVLICLILTSLFHHKLYGQEEVKIDSGFIDVSNGKIYYEVAGSSETAIIFIHDGMVHNKIWDKQFLNFANSYKVVRYDRRGYGSSTIPQKNYSNIEDLKSIYSYLNLDKAILIGMSAGGGLAIDFSLKYPQIVSSLILVGAVVRGFPYSDHIKTRGGRLTEETYNNPDKLLKYLIMEDPYEIASRNIEAKIYLWNIMEKSVHNLDFKKNRLDVQPNRSAYQFLNEIRIPTFIIVGEYDIPDVFIHAGAIEAGIKNSKRKIIKNSGHLVPLEQPEVFNSIVLKFLQNETHTK